MNAKIVLSLIAVSILAIPSVCIAQPAGVTPQAVKDFEWFSTLGFPDPKGCPLVSVDTGGWSQSGDEPRQETYEDAFLLGTNSSGFRVLTLNLYDQTYRQTNANANGNSPPPPVLQGGGFFPSRIGFDVLAPSNEVAKVLGAYRNYRRTALFTLAWGCWRNGWDLEAQQLYEQVRNMLTPDGPVKPPSDFHNSLMNEMARTMYYRALGGFGNVDITRPQLLAQFESVITNYPESEYAERAKKDVALLQRVISEDESHAKIAPTNIASLPVEQQVSDLVFRLRDQTGWQFFIPGRCNVFDDLHGSTNTPADQLARLGYAAVPQLIVALDNSTPSRAMGGWFIEARNLLTVGDCAEQVLEHIAGKNFLDNQLPGSMSNSNQLAATRKAVESWWAKARAKSEKDMLIEGVIHPSHDTPTQARMLRERYPEVAVTTLIRGAQTTTDSWVHASLVDDVSKFDEPQVTDFLNHEMSNALALEDRVRAAYDFPSREKAKAVQAMIREWENFPKQNHPEHGSLEDFLARCDSVEAIQTLGRDLRQRPADMRFLVVRCIGETNSWDTKTYSPTTLNAVEEVLASELDDTEEHPGTTGLANVKTVYDPRIGDMAGYFLAKRWPNRYVFDLSPSLSVRERQRVECLNVWRHAHNQPALPLPTPPHRVTPDQATVVTAI